MPAARRSAPARDPARARGGLALFALGFRPFYLLAAIWAALALPLWIAQYLGLIGQWGAFAPMVWHAHEMVYGFAAAVLTGFLFTAVRNWTGLPTPAGWPLAGLAAVWLAGRIAMLTAPAPLAAMLDIAFLPLIAFALWRPLARARNRNRFFVGLLLAMAAGNVLFHAAGADLIDLAPLTAVEAALAVVVVIVAIMAGRVVPMFTANAIRGARVLQRPWLDRAAIAAIASALAGHLIAAPAPVVAAFALVAAVLNAERLRGWDPFATRHTPIVWVLHVGYAWMPLGMALLAVAHAGIAGTASLALHALAIGAVGTMIIAMITRTARGHTGRPLHASPAEVVAYVLVPLAAAVRVFVPLVWPAAYVPAVIASAALWSAAFAIYAVTYWPVLTRPRIDGRPG